MYLERVLRIAVKKKRKRLRNARIKKDAELRELESDIKSIKEVLE